MKLDDITNISIKRRIQLFNWKVQNSGIQDYFNRDEKQEKLLIIEREKLIALLRNKLHIENPEDVLLKPGR
jgi:hypothetical protein